MAITFGGLATGMDTNSIVEQLMEVERAPLESMESDKTWLTSRLAAYNEFDSKLKGFLDSIEKLDSSSDLLQNTATVASDEFFTATAGINAQAETNYQVEVVGLAQVQKNVSTGFADRTLDQFGDGSVSFTVGGVNTNVTIAAGTGSLEGIMNAINDADIGVTAAIINDGTATPYRLVMTGVDTATDFSIDTSGLSNGTLLDPLTDPISVTQPAGQAHIRVDNIDIYSNSNTLSEAIPGVTLNLLKAETGTLTMMDVKTDEDTIKENIQAFVDGYNDVVSFVTSQSVIDGSDGGILSGDSGLSAVKRHLQDMLTTQVSNSGGLSYLSELGLETQRDGTLIINDTTLTSVIQNNIGDVETLLVGESGAEGIGTQFKEYLEGVTDMFDGLLAGRKQSIDSNLERIDDRIYLEEMRLEKKEQTMRNSFNAMEELVSSMNTQSSFLTQQMSMLNSMVTGNN